MFLPLRQLRNMANVISPANLVRVCVANESGTGHQNWLGAWDLTGNTPTPALCVPSMSRMNLFFSHSLSPMLVTHSSSLIGLPSEVSLRTCALSAAGRLCILILHMLFYTYLQPSVTSISTIMLIIAKIISSVLSVAWSILRVYCLGTWNMTILSQPR